MTTTNYLVIQTHDIGDVMISTSLCIALKQHFPDARVDMMTMDHCAGVVEGNPYIDNILILEKKRRSNLAYVWKFIQQLRANRYDVVINVQGQNSGLITCMASGAKQRIGYDKYPWKLAQTDNIKLPYSGKPSGLGHKIDDSFALLEPLGIHTKEKYYKLWLSDKERQQGLNTLIQHKIDPDRALVALGVNARDDYKKWPINFFAQVAEWLIDTHGAQIYIFFGPGEENYSKRLKKHLPAHLHKRIFDDIKTHNIRELACLFSHCDLYVGNDTGPRHIAQALDIPAFSVVSPASDKLGWIPWNNIRFQAVDSGDALGLSKTQWRKICAQLTPGVDDAEWLAKLDVGFVISRLSQMINALGLFQSAS